MIFSQASDINTRQRMWVGRKTDLGPQFGSGEQPVQIETEWIAGVYAEKYRKEAISSLPNFN